MSKSTVRHLERTVSFRLTQQEYETVCQQAAARGLLPAAYFRSLIVWDWRPSRSSKHRSPDKSMYSKLVGDLGAIGNNINQLSRKANMGKYPSADRLDEALDSLERVFQQLYGLLGMKGTWTQE